MLMDGIVVMAYGILNQSILQTMLNDDNMGKLKKNDIKKVSNIKIEHKTV